MADDDAPQVPDVEEVEYVNALTVPVPVPGDPEDEETENGLGWLAPGDTISLAPHQRTAGLTPVDAVDLDALNEARELVSGPGEAALEPQEGGGTTTTEKDPSTKRAGNGRRRKS